MSCYSAPKKVGSFLIFRFLINFVVVTYAVHSQRRTQTISFMEKAKAKKQQKYLQNIFDQ